MQRKTGKLKQINQKLGNKHETKSGLNTNITILTLNENGLNIVVQRDLQNK